MTPNQLLAEIRKLTSRDVDAVPDGFRGILGWAKDWKLSRQAAAEALKRALAGGLVEERKLRVRLRNGRTSVVLHYRPAKKPRG